jgi:hypothetical protein
MVNALYSVAVFGHAVIALRVIVAAHTIPVWDSKTTPANHAAKTRKPILFFMVPS